MKSKHNRPNKQLPSSQRADHKVADHQATDSQDAHSLDLGLTDDDRKLAAALKAQSEGSVIAGVTVRLLALLYDGMLILAMLFLVSLVLISIGTLAFGEVGTQASDAHTLPDFYTRFVLTPSFVLTLWGFYGLFWKKTGQTLGMQTWRLKTVTSEGRLLTWMQSALRILCACIVPVMCAAVGSLLYGDRYGLGISLMTGFLFNYLYCLVNARGLAVHDWLSNSVTLKIPKTNTEKLCAQAQKAKLGKLVAKSKL